jgi:ATPase involved in DNA repair
MKILAVRIKNLASLEGVTAIDFTEEPLCSAGIFAITGPTGSGKSTLLDALCLAMYAKTPRYAQARETGVEVTDVQGNTIGQGDVRGILRDGTADGFAEVDFVGIDGQRYRATWSVRRARGRVDGSLQQAVTRLKNLTEDREVGGRKTELLPEIVRLVGLNYEQFTRSVLLAQGDFTAFLKADKDQKASLLEKLTGTQVYSEISKKIFERYREEEQALKLLEYSRAGITTLTDEELEALTAEYGTLAGKLQQLDTAIQGTAKEIEWHESLSNYQRQLAAAEEALQQAVTEKAQSAHRERLLVRVEYAQAARSLVDSLDEVNKQLNDRSEALKRNEALQVTLGKQATAINDRLSSASESVKKRTLAEQEAKPLLDEAKKLDAQLLAKKQELADAKQRLASWRVRLDDSGKRRSEKQAEIVGLEQLMAASRAWLERHEDRRSVAENRGIIVAKLNDAHRLLEAAEKAAVEVEQCSTQITSETGERDRLANETERFRQQAEQINSQLDAIDNRLSELAVEDLNGQRETLEARVNGISAAILHWRQLWQALQEGRNLGDRLAAARQEAEEKQRQLGDAAADLQAAEQQRITSRQMLDNARLAASESIEALRTGLQSGEPCPVCGSKNHPYATQDPRLDHVLAALEKSHTANEERYNERFGYYTHLVQSIHLSEQAIVSMQADEAVAGEKIASLTRGWHAFPVSGHCGAIPPEEKERWLTEHLQEAKADLAAVMGRFQTYQSLLTQREDVRRERDALVAKQTQIANSLKDKERSIRSTLERQAYIQQEHKSKAAELEEAFANLQPHFQGTQWITGWKKNPEAFLGSINRFAEEWQQRATILETTRQQLDVQRAELTGLSTQVEQIAAETGHAEIELGNVQTAFEALLVKRQELFGGETTEAVENRLKKQLAEAQEALEHCRQEKELLQEEFTKLEVSIRQEGEEIARLMHRQTALTDRLATWLEEFRVHLQTDLDIDGLKELLGYGLDWIADTRRTVQALERVVTQATSVFNERKHQIALHTERRPTEAGVDELTMRLAQQRAAREESLREYNRLGYQLQQNETNKQQLGDLLDQIKVQATVAENWAKLNDVIGSADGKKFRQAAQEYTLDVLLDYANVHLEMLSRRYRLQRIPSTLGLQVLDQDMGDEVRTVYSLSGGESFLVSLALALGLASLSANRMQVESLFIDEGFGSLDPNTLNIAMDALERLHNQGRKVGVISHVQEMTERIPVQIRVSKQQSGKSTVEVTGA